MKYEIRSYIGTRKYQGDKLLVTTDGLYKALTEKAIYVIISLENDISEAADSLIKTVRNCKTAVDNTTFALIYL